MKVSMQTGIKQHQPLRYVGQYYDDDSALVYPARDTSTRLGAASSAPTRPASAMH
jgi:hypothetical protein